MGEFHNWHKPWTCNPATVLNEKKKLREDSWKVLFEYRQWFCPGDKIAISNERTDAWRRLMNVTLSR